MIFLNSRRCLYFYLSRSIKELIFSQFWIDSCKYLIWQIKILFGLCITSIPRKYLIFKNLIANSYIIEFFKFNKHILIIYHKIQVINIKGKQLEFYLPSLFDAQRTLAPLETLVKYDFIRLYEACEACSNPYKTFFNLYLFLFMTFLFTSRRLLNENLFTKFSMKKCQLYI